MVPNTNFCQHAIHCQFVDNGVNRCQSGGMDVYIMSPEFLEASSEDGHGVVLRYDVVNFVPDADFYDGIKPRNGVPVLRNRGKEMDLVHGICEPCAMRRWSSFGKIAGRVEGMDFVESPFVENVGNLTASGRGAIDDQNGPRPKSQVAFVFDFLGLSLMFDIFVVEWQLRQHIISGGIRTRSTGSIIHFFEKKFGPIWERSGGGKCEILKRPVLRLGDVVG